jgi:glutaredoxin 3
MSLPPPVVVYATGWCPYCHRVRALLDAKGIAYTLIDIDAVAGARAEMQQRSGRTSVPQVFIGERHIGGCDDTHALDARGELDPLLQRST